MASEKFKACVNRKALFDKEASYEEVKKIEISLKDGDVEYEIFVQMGELHIRKNGYNNEPDAISITPNVSNLIIIK